MEGHRIRKQGDHKVIAGSGKYLLTNFLFKFLLNFFVSLDGLFNLRARESRLSRVL